MSISLGIWPSHSAVIIQHDQKPKNEEFEHPSPSPPLCLHIESIARFCRFGIRTSLDLSHLHLHNTIVQATIISPVDHHNDL